MLVIERIKVTYLIAGVTEEQRPVVERVHGFHADHCPVARSISPSIAIETELDYV